MLYAHFSEKRSQNKDWWDLKSGKSMEPEPGNLLRVESSQVCRGHWRGSKPTNATCLFLSSGRHTSLKAAGFKSTVALGENGIKGWSINLPYSQVTGHLRAGILMAPLPPLLSSSSRCVIHGLSFSGSVFILLLFLCFCFLTVLKSKVLNYFMEWAQWIM